MQTAWAGDIIYSNKITDLGTSLNYPGNGLIAAGDQITFGGISRFLTTGAFQIYNGGAVDAYAATASLNLYSVSGVTLGALIGSYNLAPNNYLAGQVATLTFSLPFVAVPNDIVWTLAFSSNLLELNYFNPPTVGSSSGNNAWWDTGSGPVLTIFQAGGENYNAEFGAEAQTPEPATWALFAGGLLVLAWRRRTRPFAA